MNRLLFLALIFIAGLQNLFGHKIDAMEFEFRATPDVWTLTGTIDVTYLLPEFRNEDDTPPLTRYELMEETSPQKWRIYLDEIEGTLGRILSFRFNDKVIPYTLVFPGHRAEAPNLPEVAENIAFIEVELDITPAEGKGDLRAHWDDDMNAELIVVVEPEKDAQIFSALSDESLPLLSQSVIGEARAPTDSSIWDWLRSGFKNVIPLGLEHILFILGIFLAAPRLRPILGQSLLFTLAHSITLIGAVMGWIAFPTNFIAILIALSVAWIGLENLWLKKVGHGRMALIFAFGLLHGLGFASVFADLLGNVPREALIVPLIGFNVGVEIAQATVLIAAWLLLRPLVAHEGRIRIIGSILIAAAGFFSMVESIGSLSQ